MTTVNLFYSARDLDRWLRRDRVVGRVRRFFGRGHWPSGQTRVFLNLTAGLNALGVPFRVNDADHARHHSDALCCLIGRRRIMAEDRWANPLLIGPCVYDHPFDNPQLLEQWPVRRLLVPSEWMRRMCAPHWGDRVHAWPVGIDTAEWTPARSNAIRDIDVLVYDKIMWNRSVMVPQLLAPILSELDRRGLRRVVLRYGRYRPNEYQDLLSRSRCLVFLCEHETQGLAYQEAMSAGVPVLAWHTNSFWLDPAYYPHRVVFSPVTSVPYWDDRCGVRFGDAAGFSSALDELIAKQATGSLDPRGYALEFLTLEKCAAAFVEHVNAAEAGC